MFDPSPTPRLFALPCGVDVAQALVRGLQDRLRDAPPEAIARVEIIVNAQRMADRIRKALTQGPQSLHPRLRLVTDCGDLQDLVNLPVPVPPLRRRMEVMQLVGALIEAQPDLAPRSARYDLADQLVRLHDEMVDEGVAPDVLDHLDTEDQSGHWARALQFLRIVQPFLRGQSGDMDQQTHMRRMIERRIARWQVQPPNHPIIVAGSTGSRGTTRLLMEAVARLPQGAVVLPGVDRHMPGPVWAGLNDPMTGEDHPQFRFARLAQDLGLDPARMPDWCDMTPPDPARNEVVSLALRPAPVTDQWLRDGPGLPDLPAAMAGVTLVEAPSLRDEALAIAWGLRRAVEAGRTAALVTPDRLLARRVTAALDRWRLVPDDSAGLGLHLSAPGRLMRQTAEMLHRPLTSAALIAVLKHPLTHAGSDRGPHLRLTRELELFIRKTGVPFPSAAGLRDWAAGRRDAAEAQPWAEWVVRCLPDPDATATKTLTGWMTRHVEMTEALVAGSGDGTAEPLWAKEEGQALARVTAALDEDGARAGPALAVDYADLLTALLRGEEVRERVTPHPRIFVWGTIEVRAMGVDLLILAGLNEGTWPATPPADPWLNRALRLRAGLLLPERRIGLSAHDFQQAVAAPEVWLTRAARNDESETVPARWVNRLTNLLQGLPDRNGPEALKQMRGRGTRWLAEAEVLDAPQPAPLATRPAPAPPLAARPRQLSVTQIRTLIRDPFAIYARKVLRLKPLDPLQRAPDYMLRGTILHSVVERFVKASVADPDMLRADVLDRITAEELAAQVDWPAIRPLWQARMARAAPRFVPAEARRQTRATPTAFETMGKLELPELQFTLTCKADRIDMTRGGEAVIYDYKAGEPPSERAQKHFEKQLLLEAVIAETGGFDGLGPLPVADAVYLGLKDNAREVAAPLDETSIPEIRADFVRLIAAYMDPRRGYPARNAAFSETDAGDYDHLSRFGEWDASQTPDRVILR